MKVAIIADDALKKEWLEHGMQNTVLTEWSAEPFAVEGAGAYVDLLFYPDAERTNKLKSLQPAMIIVNSVITTLEDLPENFIRINGWPGFLSRPVVEAGVVNHELKTPAEKIFALFNKTTRWVPDVPGFAAARVICTIINEAYFALEEKVSTKEEMDMAMKLGTNYPYGPFEWGKKMGLKNVYDLLTCLSMKHSRYTPAPLLIKEALDS